MARLMMALIVAIIFFVGSLAVFPQFHTMLSSVSTTGLPPLLAAIVTSMPYAVMFGIIYGLVLIITRRSQE